MANPGGEDEEGGGEGGGTPGEDGLIWRDDPYEREANSEFENAPGGRTTDGTEEGIAARPLDEESFSGSEGTGNTFEAELADREVREVEEEEEATTRAATATVTTEAEGAEEVTGAWDALARAGFTAERKAHVTMEDNTEYEDNSVETALFGSDYVYEGIVPKDVVERQNLEDDREDRIAGTLREADATDPGSLLTTRGALMRGGRQAAGGENEFQTRSNYYWKRAYHTDTDDYFKQHQFQVKIDGIADVNSEFTSVSSVAGESEEVEMMHGLMSHVFKMPGRHTYEPVTMERVYRGVDDLYMWRQEIENGNFNMRDVTIVLVNPGKNGVKKREIVLENAWPSKWELPEMDASSSGPAIERIQLTFMRAREANPGMSLFGFSL